MNTKSLVGVVVIIIAVIAVAVYLQSYSAPGMELTGSSVATTSSAVAASTSEAVVTPTTTTTTSKPKVVQKATQTVTTRPAFATDGTRLVYYTSTGFNPLELEIKAGTSVRFVNESSRAMRIYPTLPNDLMYGKLIQGKTVGKGGTFDFAFTQPGVWGYYNENYPSDHGVIVVK